MKIKKFFIFIFLITFFILLSARSWDDDVESYPCSSGDSWTLYENKYKDTLIVVDPYGNSPDGR